LTASGGITSSTGNFTTGGNITASTGGKMLSAYYDALTDTTAGTTALRIGNNVVLGDIEIGNAQTTGDIKIGQSDASGATITIGTASTATTINGTLTATGGIKTSSLDCVADASAGNTALTIGPSVVNGNILIGASLGVGDIAIGGSQSAGGTITLGAASSIITTPGTLVVSNSIQSPFLYTGNALTSLALGTQVTKDITIGGGSIPTTIGGALTVNQDLTMGSNKTIFTPSAQQLRLGYANTQATGSGTSSFGPFFKSFGPDTVTAITYDIIPSGANGLFTPSGVDGIGGLLTIVLKSTSSKTATIIYNMSKRTGLNNFTSLLLVSNNSTGWTTNPTFATGGGDNIRITFNAADWTGATVSWMMMGSV
jgi:hypothetical protein